MANIEFDPTRNGPGVKIINKEASPKNNELEFTEFGVFYELLSFERVLKNETQEVAAARIGINQDLLDQLEKGAYKINPLNIDLARNLALYMNMYPEALSILTISIAAEKEKLEESAGHLRRLHTEPSLTSPYSGNEIFLRAYTTTSKNLSYPEYYSQPLKTDLPRSLFVLRYAKDEEDPTPQIIDQAQQIVTFPFSRYFESRRV